MSFGAIANMRAKTIVWHKLGNVLHIGITCLFGNDGRRANSRYSLVSFYNAPSRVNIWQIIYVTVNYNWLASMLDLAHGTLHSQTSSFSEPKLVDLRWRYPTYTNLQGLFTYL